MPPSLLGGLAALGSALAFAVASLFFRRLGETVGPVGTNLAKGLVAVVFTLAVVLARDGRDIRIEVKDNGRGFDVSEAGLAPVQTHGFGLFSVRTRLQHIGGRMEIESKAGRGTLVTVFSPLQEPAENGEGKPHEYQSTRRR